MKKKRILISVFAVLLFAVMLGGVIAAGYDAYVNSLGNKVVIDKDYNLPVIKPTVTTSQEKFEKADTALESYVTGTTVTIGELFTAITDNVIRSNSVQVTISSVGENSTAGGTYVANTEDWTKGTLTFTGFGDATITINDYYFCTPTTITATISNIVSVDKFVAEEDLSFTHTLENDKINKTLGDIFSAIDGVEIDSANVVVTGVDCVKNENDWTKSTITFTENGTYEITITDQDCCNMATATVTITDPDTRDFGFKFPNTADYIYRVGNANSIKLSSLFEADDIPNNATVTIVFNYINGNDVSGTYTANNSDWANGTIKFTGTGVVKITIDSNAFTNAKSLTVEVVDATNITVATAGTDKNFVLLQNVTFSSTYLYYKNATLYGNGFKIDITGADHSDLKDASDTNSNKSAYCNIWLEDSRFDNVKIIGAVYPEVGMTADSDYGNAAIRTTGECYITNSYISNCRVPLRIQGNTTLINSVVDGGRYANIELRSGKLTLDGVTTINTVRKSDNNTDVIGFGIVIHSEATNASISVGGAGLKQYNWVGETEHKNTLSGDTYLSQAYSLIFNANNKDTIYFNYDNDRYVNTGILCLCADIKKDVVSGLDDRYCQVVNNYDAWVLTYDNSNHTEWFNESIETNNVDVKSAQFPVLPEYTGANDQTVEFTSGETYYFDTSILTAKKFGLELTISAVTMNNTSYNYGDKIPLTEGGNYEVIYTVVDPYNYDANGTAIEAISHYITITVTAIAKNAEILAPKFTFIDQNGNKYEATIVKVGDKTYVMPNVTAADSTTISMSNINIGSASISGTTVYFPIATGYTVRSGSNFNRYYPLFNGINITDYTIAGDTTGTTYTTSGNYTSLVGSSGTKFIIPANGGQTNCGDYVKTDGQTGNAAGNSDSGWQGAGYNTSYGGTYLKSGNTNASSGADKNGYERIVWIEYCFNAGNGDVYYYRIGYHCNKEAAQTICVTPDTLVTLADGTKKEIQNVTVGENVIAWNFYTGKYEAVPASLVQNHGTDYMNVLHLYFEDGTELKVLGEHGIYDYDLNTFIFIDEYDVENYIGHNFVKQDGDGFTTVKLVDYKVTNEYTSAYTILSTDHYNVILEGMFTVTPAHVGDNFFNPFDVDKNMMYDEEAVKADIEKYGLYTYEEFAHVLTYEQFEALGIAEFKVSVGKGLVTYEGLIYLIENFVNKF